MFPNLSIIVLIIRINHDFDNAEFKVRIYFLDEL